MNSFISGFLLLPFFWRTAIALFVLILVLWWILGRNILWVLSLLPFLILKLSRCLYLFVEIPVALLHKGVGSNTYRISNKIAQAFERMDSLFIRWYNAWHCSKKVHYLVSLITYILLLSVITVPSMIGLKNPFIQQGELLYLSFESNITEWMENHGYYDKDEIAVKSSIFIQLNNKLQLQNGLVVESDTVPIVLNDCMYLPIRNIIEPLGGHVQWDESTEDVTVYSNGKTIVLFASSNKLQVDGEEMVLSNQQFEKNHRIFVGVKELSELLNYYVDWYEEYEVLMVSPFDYGDIKPITISNVSKLLRLG